MLAFICAAAQDPEDREYVIWLYQEFKGIMHATARKYASEYHTDEDIVQDSLLKLIPKVKTLRSLERCTLASYIVSTVRNTGINHLKAHQAEREATVDVSDDRLAGITSKGLSLDELMLLKERQDQLWKIWPILSGSEQTLLEGKYILGYTDAELARILNCQPNSIRMKLTRARRRALTLLMEQGGVLGYDEA